MKEKKEKLSDLAKHAKMSVLKNVHKMAADDMAGKLHNLKKVAVMSDSPEGLQRGLDKAKELIGAHADEQEGVSPEDSHMEHPEEREALDDMLEPKEMPGEESEPDEEGMSEEDPMHEMAESPEEEAAEHEPHDLSEEEIDRKIAHLHMLKNKKRMGK